MKKYELMALPYAPDALEPVISKETIGFHHGKHLQAYVDNLNGLASPPNPGLTPNPSPRGEGNLEGEGSLGELEMLKELLLHSEGAVFNNAGLSLRLKVSVCLALAGYGYRLMQMVLWLSRRSKGLLIRW